MAIKLKLGGNGNSRGRLPGLKHRFLRGLLLAALSCMVLGVCVLSICYFKYQSIVDERLASGPIFANVAQIYAAPREVRLGQRLTVLFIAQELRKAGYNSNPQLGAFTLSGNSIRIKPGPESYHSTDGATITTGQSADADTGTSSGPVVQSITAENGAPLAAYQLEPQLITALSGENRTKRRLVTYDEIPPNMVQAVLAIEDRRFFEHGGINYMRIAKCAVEDTLTGHKECGGSTLTMQLARGFFLSPEKKFTRKLIEIMITFQLEARFNKQQIFEMYANR